MRIRWTEPAAQDLTCICDYIEKNNDPAIARRVALTIYKGLSALTRFPRKGRPGRKPDTREIAFPHLPYFAVYRIQEDVIEILRILHGAQNWP
jgi:toxin ParE1/3/4